MAHVKTVKPHLSKLEDRSKKMVLLGYEPGAKAYRVYDPAARRVHVSRDVVFDEDAAWSWSDAEGEKSKEFVVDAAWEMVHQERPSHAMTAPMKATTSPGALARGGRSPATATPATATSPTSTPCTPTPMLPGARDTDRYYA
jgi:hypothetical protein